MPVDTTGSRTAGYVVGVLLLVPLVALAMFVSGFVGTVGLIVALAVVAAGALAAWVARRPAGSSSRRHR